MAEKRTQATETGTETQTDTETDAETEADVEIEADTETDKKTKADTETDMETETNTDTERERCNDGDKDGGRHVYAQMMSACMHDLARQPHAFAGLDGGVQDRQDLLAGRSHTVKGDGHVCLILPPEFVLPGC